MNVFLPQCRTSRSASRKRLRTVNELPAPYEKDRLTGTALSALLLRISGSNDRLRGEDGAELIAQLSRFLVPSIMRTAIRSGRGTQSWLQEADVLHTILLELFADNGRVARLIGEQAREPWGYLAVCAAEWMRKVCLSTCEELTEHSPIAPRHEPNDRLTDLEEMVARATQLLVAYAPNVQQAELRRLLFWLAQNPPQRLSHEAEDRAEMFAQFPILTSGQISAIVNIAWGGRPRRKETSLFAALLQDSQFRPQSSPTHIRALLHFRQVMRREETHSLLLWPLAA